MKFVDWILIAVIVILLGLLVQERAQAKEVFSKMLGNGAVIVLTDEPCDLTYQGKALMGNRSYGSIDGQVHKSCWHLKKGKLYIIWYESDGKTVSGVNQYDPKSFSPVQPS